VDFGLSYYAARQPLRAKRFAILLLACGETLVWAGMYYVFAALLLRWEAALGWAKTDLTLGITVAVLMSALTAPLAGRVVDAGFGRWLLGLGALAGAFALVLLAGVDSRRGFVAVWALIGVAQAACLYEPCFAFVTRTLGQGARAAITRITLVAGFASPIAFPAGAYLSAAYGWQGAVLIFAAVVALVAAPMLFAGATLLERCRPSAAPGTEKARNRNAVRAATRRPAFWLMALAFFLIAVNHGLLLNHLMPILVSRGFTEPTAVLAASIIGPMQVVGRLAIMKMENRVSALRLMVVSFAGIFLAALLLLAAGTSAGLVFAFAAMQGAAYGLISILKPVVVAETLGRTGFGAIAGYLAMPYLAGFAFAPYIGAVLWSLGGYDLAILSAGLFAVTGLLSILVLGRLRSGPAD
jgi:predicted MFS family arabinose efflux permease